MDDQFFQKVVQDAEICEEILRILLQMPDLHVVANEIERTIKETGTTVQNGTYEIYVNTAIDDGSDIAKLMQRSFY